MLSGIVSGSVVNLICPLPSPSMQVMVMVISFVSLISPIWSIFAILKSPTIG